MKIWAVEYCPCIYESAPQVLSLHLNAVKAFNKMRQLRDEEIRQNTEECLSLLGYHQIGEYLQPKCHSKGDKNDWWYRIRSIDVEE